MPEARHQWCLCTVLVLCAFVLPACGYQDRTLTAAAAVDFGAQALRNHDVESALEIADKLLEARAPASASVWARHALAVHWHMPRGEHNSAVLHLRRALTAATAVRDACTAAADTAHACSWAAPAVPESELLAALARALLDTGATGEAINVAQQAVEANGTDANVRAVYGDTLVAVGRPKDAHEQLWPLFVGDPRHTPTCLALSRALAAMREQHARLVVLKRHLQVTAARHTATLLSPEAPRLPHRVTVLYEAMAARGNVMAELAEAYAALGDEARAATAVRDAALLAPTQAHIQRLGRGSVADSLSGPAVGMWRGHGAVLPDLPAPHVRPVCRGDESPASGTCLAAGEVTLVLTVYKRSHLAEQVRAALAQTLRPRCIVVWQNGEHLSVESEVARARELAGPGVSITHVRSSHNYKYHGRFLPLLTADTEFASVWDDDMLPERRMLELFVNVSRRHGGMAGVGRRLLRIGPLGQVLLAAIGDVDKSNDNEREQQVDVVGGVWVFPTDAVRYLWGPGAPQLTFATGEDMQLSWVLSRHGLPSIVPATSAAAETRPTSASDGRETRQASFVHVDARLRRQATLCQLLRRGWKTVACDTSCSNTTLVEGCVRWARAALVARAQAREKQRQQ